MIYSRMVKHASIIVLMAIITSLRFLLPSGVAIGLLYSIPILLSVPFKIWKIAIPVFSISMVILAAIIQPPLPVPPEIIFLNKFLVVVVLALLGVITNMTIKKCAITIEELKHINEDLQKRISRYDGK